MAEEPKDNDTERTELVNPISSALSHMLEQKAARPKDVYRLAVIVEGILDSLQDNHALGTIRGELRALLDDLSSSVKDDPDKRRAADG